MSEKGTAGMIAHPLLSSDIRDRKIKGGEICSVSKWKQRQIYESLINISSFRNTSFLANHIQQSRLCRELYWHLTWWLFYHSALEHITHSVPDTKLVSGFSWEVDSKLFSGCLFTGASQKSFAFETGGIFIVLYADVTLLCSCIV